MALVGTVVYSTGDIDTVVKWNMDVALAHVTDHMYNFQCTGNTMASRHLCLQRQYSVQSFNFEQFMRIMGTHYGYSVWDRALIRERNYWIIYLGLLISPQSTFKYCDLVCMSMYITCTLHIHVGEVAYFAASFQTEVSDMEQRQAQQRITTVLRGRWPLCRRRWYTKRYASPCRWQLYV